jgi:hypothetical protein
MIALRRSLKLCYAMRNEIPHPTIQENPNLKLIVKVNSGNQVYLKRSDEDTVFVFSC